MTRFQLSGVLLLATVVGCQSMNMQAFNFPGMNALKMRSQSPEDDDFDIEKEFETEIETPMVGDYTTIAGLNLITLEGVGLVTGLDGTGGDPPPSMYRTALLKHMQTRGVHNPNTILRSPNTALVVVRGYLPPLIRKGEPFDVEVRLPGNSDATSLSGGVLLEAYLSERAIVPGRGVLEGHILAKASGAILTSTGEGNEQSLAGVLRTGRILGGGTSMTERDMTIYLRNDFRSVRNSKRLADRIGKRFHSFDRYGIKLPLAEAKTDQTIVLKIPSIYRENFPRYLQVVRNVAFRETEVARRMRIQRLEKGLRKPESAEKSSIELEALGLDAIPTLKKGLKSPNLEVRFHSAMALAYLEEPEGIPILVEAAVNERAFRVYALAALSVLDDAESHMYLRELMSVQSDTEGNLYDSSELRYGAFRSLWTLDRNDPFIQGERFDKGFWLHPLQTTGEPIIHLTHHMKSEIVLFGANQEFRTPMAVRAGGRILVTAQPGSETVIVSSYTVGEPEQRREVPKRILDVIRTAAEFGATYPDIAQMLAQAGKQHNLPGRIEIDTLPKAGRTYYRYGDTPVGDSTKRKTRVGRTSLMPNMFGTGGADSDAKQRETFQRPREDDEDAVDDAGSATLADARRRESKEKKGFNWKRFDLLRIFKPGDAGYVDVDPLQDDVNPLAIEDSSKSEKAEAELIKSERAK